MSETKTMVPLSEKLQGNVARSVNPYGCRQAVLNQIAYVQAKGHYAGAKKALIIGGSSSYGLASRITAAFGQGADTISVAYERAPRDEKMLGTAGWYNNIFFREAAEKAGLIAKNFNGDAFTQEIKDQVINYIKETFGGQIDLLVYSVAAPKRINPDNPDEVWRSVIKTVGETVTGENINLEKNELFEQTVEPATEDEIEATKHVMGGEDWEIWVNELKKAGVLAEGFKTILYSYIGPKSTYAFYHEGTLGAAKDAAEASSHKIQKVIDDINGEALISVSRAVTTKASVVIPIFPLYCLALYKVEEKTGTHETPIMHKDRLFRDMVYGGRRTVDENGRLRPDAWEQREDIQAQVAELMTKITPENFNSDLTGYAEFRREFLQLNGFEVPGADETEVDLDMLKGLEP
ncbi:enoyl-ACP reductase FabV [Lactiplantibacillus mudanjiangensis]|uniref:trans-2-enoyl-CoA reductase (NAD(+)) n=1 Tax=Lactiplantibacillus mudanjiangensis TaxID=1296538 RepID=A0A660DZD6_9LACO|nr:enoyl-ACP reductase FabV [Lactiplantibacillus mudanjiangensis]VDG19032.1 bifunctional NADH-specific enoyl-ACP reductase/trans-2-enoyl-CoA reductase [Lactobacillus sp.] [Lactiplantibacillus mudanjiangensis]VDG23245.1 bifunctional NADH-specific enoyl-ACP reductase/trans-2-enoyl-CoA reductase [Lactobacillus sp.] [Lactiplantibacillus mudanjiangensis]VDG27553.1 bifunctional NADH-specific enoyl-ACP reductase/trans-2-enoyl-CoA reductase [Lactobacillus sp.] [Lactiplantibacillus mudanjiangensis]